MATNHPVTDVTDPSNLHYLPRQLTVADLAEMPGELPSGLVRFELDNGVLITMSPSGGLHCYIQNVIAREFGTQGQLRGFGISVCGEVGIVLWRNPDRVVGADAAFFSTAKLPVTFAREGYYETIPDLVVEVISKNDTRAYVAGKVKDYFQAGVSIVWLINPAKRTLVEHRVGQEPVTFEESATVTLPDLIPGFQLPLGMVFEDPSQKR
jgi:Uma2 family endonuclease